VDNACPDTTAAVEAAVTCELAVDGVEKVVANDHALRSFTANADGRVLAL
jgi:hypothetical protein